MEIQDDNRLQNLSPGGTYIPSLMSFGVCSGSEKCNNHLLRKNEE